MMINSVGLQVVILLLLVLVSAFFSSSETSIMALNRYRLRHLAKKHHKGALRISELLQRPDRLLGVILIGNTFASILASAIATVVAVKFFGDLGVIVTSVCLTLIILIFGEITPKTLAVIYPEKIAYSVSFVLVFLLKVFYPLVFIANGIANGFLRIFNIKVDQRVIDHLTHEELRTVLVEEMSRTASNYQTMMVGILDLAGMTVDDVKVPRNEIVGINLDEDWSSILSILRTSEHNRLPIFRDTIDNVLGMLHVRKILHLLAQESLSPQTLIDCADEVYFIPEGTALNIQLLNFRKEKSRIGLIVDEYGDIDGLITLEDILEEIVGEFTTNLGSSYDNVQLQKDGSYLLEGSINIRDLNRRLKCSLPTEGPNTISGLVIETLETIPENLVCLKIENYLIEIMEMEDTLVKWVKLTILPKGNHQDEKN